VTTWMIFEVRICELPRLRPCGGFPERTFSLIERPNLTPAAQSKRIFLRII
jgi:hypothetical protein